MTPPQLIVKSRIQLSEKPSSRLGFVAHSDEYLLHFDKYIYHTDNQLSCKTLCTKWVCLNNIPSVFIPLLPNFHWPFCRTCSILRKRSTFRLLMSLPVATSSNLSCLLLLKLLLLISSSLKHDFLATEYFSIPFAWTKFCYLSHQATYPLPESKGNLPRQMSMLPQQNFYMHKYS